MRFCKILHTSAEHTRWVVLYGDPDVDRWMVVEEDRLALRSRVFVPHQSNTWIGGVALPEQIGKEHGLEWLALVLFYASAAYDPPQSRGDDFEERDFALNILKQVHEYRAGTVAPSLPSDGGGGGHLHSV